MFEEFIPKLEELISRLVPLGFVALRNIGGQKFREASNSGYIMMVRNPIIGKTIADCSHLHADPFLIFQPRTEDQLAKIVTNATDLGVPITFASGKTGLSGGFLNPFILVDLEQLSTMMPPIEVDLKSFSVYADQKVTLGDLIATVRYKTSNHYLFPTQPSSAFKLPVMLGGAIATNASGVTSGKLGPIQEWILSLRYMTPQGEIEEILPDYPQFTQVVGGMGKYGVILSARIKLAAVPVNLSYGVCFGHDIKSLLPALEEVRVSKIFPLINEFVMSPDSLYGKFKTLEINSPDPLKWAILLKGNNDILENYQRVLNSHTHFNYKKLSAEEFQEYIEERAAMAIMALPDTKNEEYIRYPGFEDVLIPPLRLWDVFKRVNKAIQEFKFPEIKIPYGHLNFRKGQGILLHLRMPVKVSDLCEDSHKTKKKVAKAMAAINYLLYIEMGLTPKAEHSVGSLEAALNEEKIQSMEIEIAQKTRMPDPHLLIYQHVRQTISEQFYSVNQKQRHLKTLESLIYGYLTGEFKINYAKRT